MQDVRLIERKDAEGNDVSVELMRNGNLFWSNGFKIKLLAALSVRNEEILVF